jgi:hypothetical protein
VSSLKRNTCYCQQCGGTELRYEAWAEFDEDLQVFVFAGHNDDGMVWCDDCDEAVEADMGDPADWEPADEEDDEDDVCGSDVSEGGAA